MLFDKLLLHGLYGVAGVGIDSGSDGPNIPSIGESQQREAKAGDPAPKAGTDSISIGFCCGEIRTVGVATIDNDGDDEEVGDNCDKSDGTVCAIYCCVDLCVLACPCICDCCCDESCSLLTVLELLVGGWCSRFLFRVSCLCLGEC